MVCAALAREAGFEVIALTIDYGQRHRDRARGGRARSPTTRGPPRRSSARPGVFGGSALTADIAFPRPASKRAFPSLTFLRATQFSSALPWVSPRPAGVRDIFIGVNALDYSGYPDCRPEFIAAFQRPCRTSRPRPESRAAFTIHAPLQDMTKADIAREASRLGLDAGLSHSCYDPAPDGRHCGRCDACRLRAKGFARIGDRRPDPRLTHELRGQGNLSDASGRGRAGRPPGGLPAVSPAATCGRGVERDRASASAASAIPISSASTGMAGASSPTRTRSPIMSMRLWGKELGPRLVVVTGGEPLLQLDVDAARGAPRSRLRGRGRDQRHAARAGRARLAMCQPQSRNRDRPAQRG